MSKLCDKARRLKKRRGKLQKFIYASNPDWKGLGTAISDELTKVMLSPPSPIRYVLGIETKEQYLARCKLQKNELAEYRMHSRTYDFEEFVR